MTRRTWAVEVEALFESSDRAAALVEQAMERITQEGTPEPGTPLAWQRVWEDVVARLAIPEAEPFERHVNTSTTEFEHDWDDDPATEPEEGDETDDDSTGA